MSNPWILRYAEALGQVISPLQGLVPAGHVEMLEGASRNPLLPLSKKVCSSLHSPFSTFGLSVRRLDL